MSEEENKRTATEVLLSIEEEVKLIKQYQRNTDSVIKILLARFNEFVLQNAKLHVNKPAVEAPSAPPMPAPPIPQTIPKELERIAEKAKPGGPSLFEQAAAAVGIDASDTAPVEELPKMTAKPATLPPDPRGEELLEAPVRNALVRTSRTNPNAVPAKLTVSQVLYRNDGQPLFLANVEIINSMGELVKQARTNTKGRWIVALDPGVYTVRVVKSFNKDSGILPVDKKYQIDVPTSVSNPNLELDELLL